MGKKRIHITMAGIGPGAGAHFRHGQRPVFGFVFHQVFEFANFVCILPAGAFAFFPDQVQGTELFDG